MLEIIAIFVLGKAIKKIALEKELKPTKYILIMIFFWLSFEFLGIVLGFVLFEDGLIPYLLALPAAALGGYLSYTIVKNA